MRRQAIRYTASGLVGVVLVVALTLMVNWVGARHWARADWTSSNLYTLSEKTRNILAELTDPIEVVVFMTPASNLFDQVHELLERYASASDTITVSYIDPDKEPLKTKQLAEKFGISVANTVVFTAGERSKYVTSDQMAELDYRGMQYGQPPSMKAFKGEEQFTSAILSLVAPRVPKIYFLTGHGEASIGGGGGQLAARSLSVLQEALKRENIEVADTSLLSGEVPEDADVLAIIGPTHPYTEIEIERLGRYLDGGGRLLVCLDPLISSDGTMSATRLEAFLAEHGVEVHDDLVIDPSHRLPFFDLSAVYLVDFPPHPVTTGLEGTAVLFPVTRSLAPLEGAGREAKTIVETSDQGWGETNLAQLVAGRPVDKDDADAEGPVAVAVAVAETGAAGADEQAATGEGKEGGETPPATPSEGARIVAFGDSDFLADREISNAGNLTLAVNAFDWLAAREQSLGIPPRAVEQVSLFLSGSQMRTILLVTLLAMPGLAIVVGVFVWRRRRH